MRIYKVSLTIEAEDEITKDQLVRRLEKIIGMEINRGDGIFANFGPKNVKLVRIEKNK